MKCSKSTAKAKKRIQRKRSDAKVIPAFSLEARIKRRIREHLKKVGFTRDAEGGLLSPTDSKAAVRALHHEKRLERLRAESKFVKANWPKLQEHFANGCEVDPVKLKLRLEIIRADTWQSRLFRLAALTWAVPVSAGYGRRMRFLVWDSSNDKLVGLIGLADPVFNLSVRDDWIGWKAEDRKKRLVYTLDAFVLGAIPPYSKLLAGKMLACLLRSKEIKTAFDQRYGNSRGIISRKKKKASLVLVSTSSALGRSSVYNRVVLGGQKYLLPVGFSKGWGHFHMPEGLFKLVRTYLQEKEDVYFNNNRFGDGPNWKLRALRKAFALIGVSQDLLKHGIGREVYVCPIADNVKQFLSGKHKRIRYTTLQDLDTITEAAKERWLVPRANRDPSFKDWVKSEIRMLLSPKHLATVKRAEVGGSLSNGTR